MKKQDLVTYIKRDIQLYRDDKKQYIKDMFIILGFAMIVPVGAYGLGFLVNTSS